MSSSPVLITDCNSRKGNARTVSQIGRSDDVEQQILTDVVDKEADCVGEQDEEDGQPVDLPRPRGRESGIAETSNRCVRSKVGQSIPDYFSDPHFIKLNEEQMHYYLLSLSHVLVFNAAFDPTIQKF